MKRNLFLFTVGPVQSFIAQARKTRDFYYGSLILSSLCKAAIEYLKELKPDCTVIFPNELVITENDDNLPLPNRFLASVSFENEQEVYEIANKIKHKVIITFHEYSHNDFKLSNRKLYEKQIEDFLEIYWVSTEEKDNYLDEYLSLEKALGAIKNTRHFNQSELNPGLRKCSICGERDALIFNKKELQKNEELCAICWTKRKFKKSFLSTATISVMDKLFEIKNIPEGEFLLNEYISCFKNEYNEELLFEENLTEQYFIKNNLELSYLNKDTLEKYHNLKEFMNSNNLKFTKYYALIALDGDNMGKWLSGTYFKNDISNFREVHKKISLELVKYSKKIFEIIKEPKGKVVYTGGDDILALVNINYLFDVLKEIRQEFPQFSNDKVTTASCGVCIAHYKTPLQKVVKWTKKAERTAKSVINKDSCSFVILKHAGDIVQGTFKWYHENLNTIDIIKDVVMILKEGVISSSFINKILEEFTLVDIVSSNIIETETKRLIRRSYINDDKNPKYYVDKMIENIINLFNITKNSSQNYIKDFSQLLKFISFLDRRGD